MQKLGISCNKTYVSVRLFSKWIKIFSGSNQINRNNFTGFLFQLQSPTYCVPHILKNHNLKWWYRSTVTTETLIQTESIYASLEVFTVIEFRVSFFWDMKQCHWISSSWHFKAKQSLSWPPKNKAQCSFPTPQTSYPMMHCHIPEQNPQTAFNQICPYNQNLYFLDNSLHQLTWKTKPLSLPVLKACRKLTMNARSLHFDTLNST